MFILRDASVIYTFKTKIGSIGIIGVGQYRLHLSFFCMILNALERKFDCSVNCS